jgi:DNA-binding NtrC family response regulator
MPSNPDRSERKRNRSDDEQRRCIMLLDSLPRLAEQLADILDDSSICVATTTRWKHALELSVAGKIDLVICDLELVDDGASQLFHEVKSTHPNLLPSLLFSRNVMTRPEATFLNAGERRELLDRPFKNDQAIKILTRRLTRVGIRSDHY